MPTPPEATLKDVLTGYQEFLGREPESAEAIVEHLRGEPSIWELIRRLYDSPEAQRRRLCEAVGAVTAQQDTRNVETDAAPADADRLLAHVEEVWSRYGREEAYYSVLTDPKYLKEHLGVADVDAFYESGEGDVRHLEAVLHRNGIVPNSAWSVLELGCGVGRVGEAFAKRFRVYTGVDISAEHLALAKARLATCRVDNAAFLALADAMRSGPDFDLFFSILVLQHNPPPIIKKLLGVFLDRLSPGGYAYFQVPCFIYDYSFSVASYLEGKGRRDTMEMHPLPQHEVFGLLATHGLVPISVTPDALIGPLGFSYTFLARKA